MDMKFVKVQGRDRRTYLLNVHHIVQVLDKSGTYLITMSTGLSFEIDESEGKKVAQALYPENNN